MVAETPGLQLSICRDVRVWQWRPPRFTWLDPIDPVTFWNGNPVTDFGSAMPAKDIRHPWVGFGIAHTSAVLEVTAATQVCVRDVDFDRNDRLWSALARAAGWRRRAHRHSPIGGFHAS
jgi:hypothetical protein